MKYLITSLLVFAISGCGSAGSTNSASGTVAGVHDGSYLLKDVECYSPDLSTLLQAGTFIGVYSDSLNLSGDNLIETLTAGSCSIGLSGTITLQPSGNYYTSTIGVTAASGCTQTPTLTNGSITIFPTSTTYPTGSSTITATTNGQWFYNPSNKNLAISTSDYFASSAKCFIVYIKQ